jgi:four helix bundle protein
MDLTVETYQSSEHFPKSEMFGLQSQMRRAAVSVPANIAEGSNLHHKGEFIQAIGIALGSLGELETYYELSKRLGYIDDVSGAIQEAEELGRMLNGLRRSIETKPVA